MKPALLIGRVPALLPGGTGATGCGSICGDGTDATIALSLCNYLDPYYDGLPAVFKERQIGACADEVVPVAPDLLMPASTSETSASLLVTAPLAGY